MAAHPTTTPFSPPEPGWPEDTEPMLPGVDPTFWLPLWDISTRGSIPQPPSEFLDKLFYTEEVQLRDYAGTRTWEFPVVNLLPIEDKNDFPSQRCMYDANWKPNENEWFRILRKSHWLNSNQKVLNSFPELRDYGFDETDTWSVDNSKIWRELSKVIDLANHILSLAAHGKWLRSLIKFPDVKDYIGQSGDGKPLYGIRELPENQMGTPEEVRAWLNSDALNQYPYWALESDSEAWKTGGAIKGVFRDLNWTGLSTLPFRWLLKLESDSPSACAWRIEFASTLVHELTHFLVRNLMYKYPQEPHAWEPFYLDEPIAECGHSHITSLIGPDFYSSESLDFEANPKIHAGAVCEISLWPHYYLDPWRAIKIPARSPAPGREGTMALTVHHLSTYWSRWIQTEEFWKTYLPQGRVEALQTPRVLHNYVVSSSWTAYLAYGSVAKWDKAAAMLLPQAMMERYDMIFKELQYRRQTWAALRRPWYDQTRARWAMSPHSAVSLRRALEVDVLEALTLPRTPDKEALFQHGINMLFSLPHGNQSKQEFFNDAAVHNLKAQYFRGLNRLISAVAPPRFKSTFDEEVLDRGVIYSNSASWATDPHAPLGMYDGLREDMSKPRCLGHVKQGYTLHPRHLDATTGLPSGLRRASCLQSGKAMLEDALGILPYMSANLRSATSALYLNLKAQAQNYSAETFGMLVDCVAAVWLQYDFKLPPYIDSTHPEGKFERDYLIQSANAMYASFGKTMIHTIPGVTDKFEIIAALPAGQTLDEQAQLTLAQIDISVPRLTIGRLHDLQAEMECRFILVQTEGWDIEAYMVYEVQQALRVPNQEMLIDLVEKSPYGPALKKEPCRRFLQHIASQDQLLRPVAKVIQWVGIEDAATRDGTDGKPLWIRDSDAIYDITDLNLGPDREELLRLLKSKPGDNPMYEVMQKGYDTRAIVAEDLADLQVGIVPPVGLSVGAAPALILSREELEWHEFEETGMFMQIYDDIYDIGSGFAEYHPGGVKILADMAGRDGTALFEHFHPENGKELLESVQALKIGRVVKTYLPKAKLGADEIRLRDRIFDVSSLKGTPEYDELRWYRGTDATEDLEKQTKKDAWPARLWNKHKDLVVGKVSKDYEALPHMSRDQLKKHNGATVDEHYEHAAFVAVGKSVIDVTTLMRYGPPELQQRLEPYLGGRVKQRQLADWLLEYYSSRRVARLTSSKTPKTADWDPIRIRDLKGDVLKDLMEQCEKQEEDYRKAQTPVVEWSEWEKKRQEMAERDMERFSQVAPLEGASRKRKWATDEDGPFEMLKGFAKAIREVLRFFNQAKPLSPSEGQRIRKAEDALRVLIEEDPLNTYWNRDVGVKKIRV